MKIESLHSLFLKYPNISTDTRKTKENDIFFALKGDNFNGNTYTQQALKKGASYVVIDEKEFKVNEKTIVVKDALQTLQQLANFHRNYSNAKIPAQLYVSGDFFNLALSGFMQPQTCLLLFQGS